MGELTHHYCVLLDTNREAFAQSRYLVAYHSLAAAMYCAVGAKDAPRLEEVLHLGYEQLDELIGRLGDVDFPDEPVEVSLYRSLVQMTRTRLLLFGKS